MKRALFPPSVRDTKKVIDYLDTCCAKLKCESHYHYLRKMKEAGFSAWGLIITSVAFQNFTDSLPQELLLLSLSALGIYIVTYAYRCEKIMEAFHMNHLENIDEIELTKHLSESTTNRPNEA